jgi:hypothetical protein
VPFLLPTNWVSVLSTVFVLVSTAIVFLFWIYKVGLDLTHRFVTGVQKTWTPNLWQTQQSGQPSITNFTSFYASMLVTPSILIPLSSSSTRFLCLLLQEWGTVQCKNTNLILITIILKSLSKNSWFGREFWSTFDSKECSSGVGAPNFSEIKYRLWLWRKDGYIKKDLVIKNSRVPFWTLLKHYKLLKVDQSSLTNHEFLRLW